jgi:hypothetical protein
MTNERTQPRELLQLHRRVEEIWNTTEENQGSEGARIVENAVDKNRSRSRACARYNRFEWNETRMHGQHSAHCKRTGIAFQGEQLVLVRAVSARPSSQHQSDFMNTKPLIRTSVCVFFSLLSLVHYFYILYRSLSFPNAFNSSTSCGNRLPKKSSSQVSTADREACLR